MFEKKVEYVIFIGKEELFLIKTDFTKPSGYSNIEKYDWNASNLREVIEGIYKKHEVNNLGFLLSDDLVYIFSTKVNSNSQTKNIEYLLEQKVKEKIPEDVRELTWDYRSKESPKDSKVYQIAAINNKIANILEGFISHAEVKVQFIEPFSYALARLTKNRKKFHAIVYSSDFSNCMLIAHEGYVYYVQTFDPALFESEFNSFNNYSNHKYLMDKNSEVIVSSNLSSIKLVTGENTDWIVEESQLNPMHIFEDNTLYKGKDSEVLNISLNREDDFTGINKIMPSKFFSKETITKLSSSLKGNGRGGGKGNGDTRRLVLMVGFLVILILVAAFLLLSRSRSRRQPSSPQNMGALEIENSNNLSNKNETNSDELVDGSANRDDEMTEKLLSEEVKFSVYTVQILNGTGAPGTASEAKSLLEEAGFLRFNLGNAETFDYQNTVIKVKKDVPAEALDTIQTSLSTYDLEISDDTLDEDYEFDIQIALGSTRL